MKDPDLQLEELRRELDAARADEAVALADAAAGRELLRALGREPTEEASNLDAVAEWVARACSADDALIARINGSTLRPFAHSNDCTELPTGLRIPLRRTMPMTRAAAERRTVHVPDLEAVSEAEYPDVRQVAWVGSARTLLAAPLLHGRATIGVVCARRRASRPFSERQVERLERLADQIAAALALIESIHDTNRQLEEAVRRKSDFLDVSSNELRTPLNAIIGFSELLLEGILGEVNDRQEDCLRRIDAAGKNLLGLINDIVDLSRIEAGRMELRRSTFSIAALLEEARTAVQAREACAEFDVMLDAEPGLEMITADEHAVKGLASGILLALRRLGPSERPIEVSVRREGPMVRLTFVASGLEVPQRDLQHIFASGRPGPGDSASVDRANFGLAFARGIAELHGGQIWAESAPGVGTRFVFTLPLQ